MNDIGTKIHYERTGKGKDRDVTGTIVDKKKGNTLRNVKTGEVCEDTFNLKIKPDDGSRAFWTGSMRKT